MREATAIMQLMVNNVDEVNVRSSVTPTPDAGRCLNIPTGNQWRQDFRKWLSSPDPSTNHIISCGTQHEGTAKWFFRGSLFEEWKSTGSLLWIHGKRTSSNPSLFHSNETRLFSGLWEECSLVRCFSSVFFSGNLSYLLALRSSKIS